MSDERDHPDGPPPEPQDPDAPSDEQEEAAAPQAPEEPDEQLPQGQEPEQGEEPAPAEEQAEGEEPSEPGEEPLEGEEPEEEAVESPPPAAEARAMMRHDGLESGLAWFGEPLYVPALPPGAAPPAYAPAPDEVAAEEEAEEEVVAPARPAVSVAERRQRMRDRLEARRAEKRSRRSWYQRVPIPVWLSLPATIFIVVYLLIVRPWDRIPQSTERMDPALLTAPAVEDQAARLREAGLDATPGDAWRLLPSGELVMAEVRRQAAVTWELDEPLTHGEISCEACLIRHGYVVSLALNGTTELRLDAGANPPGIRKRPCRGSPTEMPFPILSDHWYRLTLRLEPGGTRFFVNGYELERSAARPREVRSVVLGAQEARAAFRRWKVTPLPTD